MLGWLGLVSVLFSLYYLAVSILLLWSDLVYSLMAFSSLGVCTIGLLIAYFWTYPDFIYGLADYALAILDSCVTKDYYKGSFGSRFGQHHRNMLSIIQSIQYYLCTHSIIIINLLINFLTIELLKQHISSVQILKINRYFFKYFNFMTITVCTIFTLRLFSILFKLIFDWVNYFYFNIYMAII